MRATSDMPDGAGAGAAIPGSAFVPLSCRRVCPRVPPRVYRDAPWQHGAAPRKQEAGAKAPRVRHEAAKAAVDFCKPRSPKTPRTRRRAPDAEIMERRIRLTFVTLVTWALWPQVGPERAARGPGRLPTRRGRRRTLRGGGRDERRLRSYPLWVYISLPATCTWHTGRRQGTNPLIS